ncbi:MAG: type ISP restriction/modification enzyme [Aggregatilineales bacterium]
MQNQTPPKSAIKASHRAIAAYREKIADYDERAVAHETGRRFAFQALLEDTARLHHWAVTAEDPFLTRSGKTIRPDATLARNATPRGYWEAKDLDDDLETEIRKKIAAGYPTDNIIFEDSQRAVLYQDSKRVDPVFDLTSPADIAELLNLFYDYTAPHHVNFDRALAAFKETVPRLSARLQTLITDTRRQHADFANASDAFLALLQRAINPDIDRAEVDKMLIQHLLTERVIRRLFDSPDFARRNAIAAEIEKVIDALTRHSFSRDEYLRDLDRYYLAIEDAARGLDFRKKQNVLNVVYETFFQGFSEKQADTHGIVYTPQPIVDFMCDSVVEALKTEFNLRLDSPEVQVLDPATGTGNFIVHLLDRLPATTLPEVYAGRLFANEILLMPYYIAALNIEHAYFEKTGQYEPFQGLCYVDTLSLEHGLQRQLTGFSEENDRRVQRQGEAPITVIIGNPPYNVGQRDENDNNKNRPYTAVDNGIRKSYAKDSRATLKAQLYDAYVRFFWWAKDRLGTRDGIVCYVTNNSFMDQMAFDGFRKHLLQDFTQVYHVDLHGNVRQNPKLSGTTHNVFGIQVGVGITVAIRHASHTERKLFYFRVPEDWRKEQKYDWLRQKHDIGSIEWRMLMPDGKNRWLTATDADQFALFVPIGSKETKQGRATDVAAIFKQYSGGVKTNRDEVVYDFDRAALLQRMETFVDDYNAEVDRYKRTKAKSDAKAEKIDIDRFVDYTKIKWDGTLKGHLQHQQSGDFDPVCVRLSLYRPFTKRWLYFDRQFINSIYLQHQFFPTPTIEHENRVIWLKVGSDWPMFALMANCIVDLLPQSGSQCFPFYTYDPDGTNRRENITDWALAQFRAHYADESIGKWDIFYYVYGALHRPAYRVQFADALKRELPRIPYLADFWAVSKAGKQLADLHLNYETGAQYPLTLVETPNVPLTFRIADKMRLSRDKTEIAVNPSLTLRGIPAEAFEYKLGNRSALEWVIDQYQVKGSSDPNRADDERYIVKLVGQVIRVSVETVGIVKVLG